MSKDKIKPVFGDQDQIELMELEKKNDGLKSISHVECDCNCEFCENMIEQCPYCDQVGIAQFIDSECLDCGKKCTPDSEHYKMEKLREKILKNNKSE